MRETLHHGGKVNMTWIPSDELIDANVEEGRWIAARIPGARFVELPGSENDIFLGDTAPVFAEIERFFHEDHPDLSDDRPCSHQPAGDA